MQICRRDVAYRLGAAWTCHSLTNLNAIWLFPAPPRPCRTKTRHSPKLVEKYVCICDRISRLPVKTRDGGGQRFEPARVDDVVLGNEVSKAEQCLSLSNVPSSEVEKCLTLSVHWNDPPMLAVIVIVFIKRDLQTTFCLTFVADKACDG